jgi:hypothetical protein
VRNVPGQLTNVGLRVRESKLHAPDLAHAATFIGISLSGIYCQASDGYALHLWCQAFPGLREVGQNEDRSKTDSHRYSAFNDVQPKGTGCQQCLNLVRLSLTIAKQRVLDAH